MWSPVRFIRICETNVCISVFRNRNSKNLSLDCKHFSLPVFDSRILIFAITRTKLYKHWCQIILGLKVSICCLLWHFYLLLFGMRESPSRALLFIERPLLATTDLAFHAHLGRWPTFLYSSLYIYTACLRSTHYFYSLYIRALLYMFY